MMELFIVTNYEKIAAILTFVALMCALVVNYSQSEEIQELRNRIDVLEKFTSALIDLV